MKKVLDSSSKSYSSGPGPLEFEKKYKPNVSQLKSMVIQHSRNTEAETAEMVERKIQDLESAIYSSTSNMRYRFENQAKIKAKKLARNLPVNKKRIAKIKELKNKLVAFKRKPDHRKLLDRITLDGPTLEIITAVRKFIGA